MIAPTYGIILNSPIKNPNNGAYFIPIIVIAIVTNIPTTIASKNWLAINLKNISFELLKYLSIFLYVLSLKIALANFFKKPNISSLSDKI